MTRVQRVTRWWVATTVVVMGVVLAIAVVGSQSLPVGQWVKVMPPDRGMPGTVVLLKEVLDETFLCVELPGQAACRPVGEVRKWLKQSQPRAK